MLLAFLPKDSYSRSFRHLVANCDQEWSNCGKALWVNLSKVLAQNLCANVVSHLNFAILKSCEASSSPLQGFA